MPSQLSPESLIASLAHNSRYTAVLDGLKAAKALNGQKVTVVSYRADKKRFVIQTADGEKAVRWDFLKNIQLVVGPKLHLETPLRQFKGDVCATEAATKMHNGLTEEQYDIQNSGHVKQPHVYGDLIIQALKKHVNDKDYSRVLILGAGRGNDARLLLRAIDPKKVQHIIFVEPIIWGRESIIELMKDYPHISYEICHVTIQELPDPILLESAEGSLKPTIFIAIDTFCFLTSAQLSTLLKKLEGVPGWSLTFNYPVPNLGVDMFEHAGVSFDFVPYAVVTGCPEVYLKKEHTERSPQQVLAMNLGKENEKTFSRLIKNFSHFVPGRSSSAEVKRIQVTLNALERISKKFYRLPALSLTHLLQVWAALMAKTHIAESMHCGGVVFKSLTKAEKSACFKALTVPYSSKGVFHTCGVTMEVEDEVKATELALTFFAASAPPNMPPSEAFTGILSAFCKEAKRLS